MSNKNISFQAAFYISTQDFPEYQELPFRLAKGDRVEINYSIYEVEFVSFDIDKIRQIEMQASYSESDNIVYPMDVYVKQIS